VNHGGISDTFNRTPDYLEKALNSQNNSSSVKKPDYTKYSPQIEGFTKTPDLLEKSLLSLLKNSGEKQKNIDISPYEKNNMMGGPSSGKIQGSSYSNKKK
jgi:hypothetical protein